MKNKKIVIAGGTGFIGQEMIRYWCKSNDLVILTRNQANARNNRNQYTSIGHEELNSVCFIQWDGKSLGDWSHHLNGADLIINLTGRSVNCRYTKKNKTEILFSRLNAVNVFGEAIRQCQQPPPAWINASSATIYRDANDRPQDEYTGEFHDGFSVDVCRAWEKKFFDQAVPATRKVALRMAITLGPGGVLIPYFNLLKFGLGGRQGDGHQMFSWVHAEDSCRMIEWIEEHDKLEGIFNCCSPNPVSNRELMTTLREVTGRKFGLPAFKWMLRVGAALIGTETELVLKSRWVLPTRILETGFQFNHPHLKEALTDIISRVPRRQYHLF